MPTSAHGISNGRGFTLIELLVVLLIMGLFIGLVSSIARPDERALLRVEADRLAQLLELAGAQARLTGQSVGWTSDGAGYRFWRIMDDGGWAQIGGGDELRARNLPRGVSIHDLRIETMPSPGTMRLVFTPDSLAPAFTLGISVGDLHYTVAASPVGDLEVLQGSGEVHADMALR